MYDYRIYYGYIVQGDLRAAIDYIKKFRRKKGLVKKYQQMIEQGKPIRHSKNKVLNDICLIFDEYYRKVFWLKEERQDTVQYLCDAFSELLGMSSEVYLNLKEAEQHWEILEDKVAGLAEKEGYHYLGGKTQGFYGPYIWKTTKRKIYQIKLPNTIEKFPLDMLSGFISCSWMSYISFGKIGTGGWAGSDGVLACVKKRYWYRMMTSRFKVDFLKHEAQHAVDKRQIPGISDIHLEYKAKLVQLIYANNMNAFWGFVTEASKEDTGNSHAAASYLLIRNLSQLIFGEPFVTALNRWKGRKNEIRKYAGELYDCYPDKTEMESTENV